jgi:uncharacterized membrane protein YbhN (UPF0104 family)
MVDAALKALEAGLSRFGRVSVPLVALALALHLANVLLRSVAWRNVLRAAHPHDDVGLLDVGSAYAAGVALNAVAVSRGGDVAKALLMRARIPGSALPTIGATLAVTGLFDVAAAGLALFAAWRLGAVPAPPALPGGIVVAVVVGVLVVAALALALGRGRARSTLGGLYRRVLCGGAILRTPGRYLRQVVAFQALGWIARIGVVFSLLHAFHIDASIGEALLVIVLGGVATAFPSGPGGAGAQQLAVTYALHETTSAAAALTFSVGMQVGITVVNAGLGTVAAMVLFRTVRPAALLLHGRRLAATGRGQ